MIVSSVVVLEAVVGRREWRDSWRRFCTPWSLLKDELDLENLVLLLKLLLAVEKLLADGSRRLNMVARYLWWRAVHLRRLEGIVDSAGKSTNGYHKKQDEMQKRSK